MEKHALGLSEDPTLIWIEASELSVMERRRFRKSLCAALWCTLGLIWVPGLEGKPLPDRIELVPADPVHFVLKLDPVKPEQQVLTQRKKNPTPMPDLTLDDPEPVMAEVPVEEEKAIVPIDDAWTLAPPEAPAPSQDVIQLNEQTPGVVAPVITQRIQPEYPQRGRQLRMQGYVILDAVLLADGTVGAVTVLQSLGKGRFGFEDKAIEAVRQWRFIPGSYRGKPADIHLTLRITFNLK